MKKVIWVLAGVGRFTLTGDDDWDDLPHGRGCDTFAGDAWEDRWRCECGMMHWKCGGCGCKVDYCWMDGE
jgi:hypothetical protein